MLRYDSKIDKLGFYLFQQLHRFTGITAVRLVHGFTCHTAEPLFVNIIPTSESAPKAPNTWTDGSLSSSRAMFASDGFGIWHPHRRDCEIAVNELAFGRRVDVGQIHGIDGVALAETVLGPSPQAFAMR